MSRYRCRPTHPNTYQIHTVGTSHSLHTLAEGSCRFSTNHRNIAPKTDTGIFHSLQLFPQGTSRKHHSHSYRILSCTCRLAHPIPRWQHKKRTQPRIGVGLQDSTCTGPIQLNYWKGKKKRRYSWKYRRGCTQGTLNNPQSGRRDNCWRRKDNWSPLHSRSLILRLD